MNSFLRGGNSSRDCSILFNNDTDVITTPEMSIEARLCINSA